MTIADDVLALQTQMATAQSDITALDSRLDTAETTITAQGVSITTTDSRATTALNTAASNTSHIAVLWNHLCYFIGRWELLPVSISRQNNYDR